MQQAEAICVLYSPVTAVDTLSVHTDSSRPLAEGFAKVRQTGLF